MIRFLRLVPALFFLLLAGCDYPPADKPQSVSDLGIATPRQPVGNVAKLETSNTALMQMPVPAPAVSRATDAGANDEGGMIEPRE